MAGPQNVLISQKLLRLSQFVMWPPSQNLHLIVISTLYCTLEMLFSTGHNKSVSFLSVLIAMIFRYSPKKVTLGYKQIRPWPYHVESYSVCWQLIALMITAHWTLAISVDFSTGDFAIFSEIYQEILRARNSQNKICKVQLHPIKG